MGQAFRDRYPLVWSWLWGDEERGIRAARATMTDKQIVEEIERRTGEKLSTGTIRNWALDHSMTRKPPGFPPRATSAAETLQSSMLGKAHHKDRTLPGMEQSGDTLTITSDLHNAPKSANDLLVERGLSPDDWVVKILDVTDWQSAAMIDGEWVTTTLYRTRATFQSKVPFRLLLPPPEPLVYTPPPPRPQYLSDRPQLILVTTDSQVPFHDERLHQISCQFAHDMSIDMWVDLGDFLDLPSLSKYRAKPEFAAGVQESIDMGHRVLRERTAAAPEWCVKQKLSGNHDIRQRNYLIDRAPEMWGVRRADVGPEEHLSVLDPDYLMRSAELGWDRARSPFGEYPYECVEIAPNLIGIHGESVGRGGGNSVRKELESRDYSLAMGHCNKLAAHIRTRWRVNGEPFDVWGIEAGYMGQVRGGLGFAGPTPDWAQGFLVVTVYNDGSWLPELAPYRDGKLFWRDRVFRG